jgi:hypothetical protein
MFGWRLPQAATKPSHAILMAAVKNPIYLRHFHEAETMAEPQLSVRSAKARDLAHRLARREKRSIADVVERALEAYELRQSGREPPETFYARLAMKYGTDIDLEAVIREKRRPHSGPDL